jgi:hypothetical protein
VTTAQHQAEPRARGLTAEWGGEWNDATGRARNAACPACGEYAVSITPKGSKLFLICNGCRAGAKGDNRLVDAARMAGYDCGPGNGRRYGGLLPASAQAIVGLKKAERRVLKFVAAQTSTAAWFEVSQRKLVAECGGSKRDAIPILERLAERGLLRIMSNKHAAKRPTQVAFSVDPVDLCVRLADRQPAEEPESPSGEMVSPPKKMVSPWINFQNGVTPPENGVTMDRRPYVVR